MWGLGYVVFAIGALGNLLLTDLGPAIYLCRACNVFGAAIVFASSLTYVSQTTPESRRTEAIGILGVGGFLGMLVGPYLGDFFLQVGTRQRSDFVWLFMVAAAANLLPAFMLLLMRSPANDRVRGPVRLREFVSTTRRYWPGMILFVHVTFGVCMTGPLVFVASFVDQVPVRIANVSVIGLFFWCYAGLAICIRLLLRRLPDRIGPARVLVAGGVLMSLGMYLFSMVDSHHPWLIVAPALLCGAGHGLMFHTMTSLTLQSFPLEVRGTGSALGLMMLDFGMLAGAPILGQLGDRFGYAVMFQALSGFCLLSTLAYAWSDLQRTSGAGKSSHKPVNSF